MMPMTIKEVKSAQMQIKLANPLLRIKFEKAFPLRYDWRATDRKCSGHRYFEDICDCKKGGDTK